jgi:two-component system, LytTR family, sensor kinase
MFCWLLWFWLGPRIYQAPLLIQLARAIPISILLVVCEELLWVKCVPNWPEGHRRRTYWEKVDFQLNGEFLYSLLIFWCAFFLVRGVGYYLLYREKEHSTQQLETRLVHSQIQALRMQLNPHFLFNTLNSISSLMRVDVVGADAMLEELSALLRITFERGETQLIPLRDEMDFVETYISIQRTRFAGCFRQEISIEPNVFDALVPTLILQPIVENAFVHGISRLSSGGLLAIKAAREGENLKVCVANDGPGISSDVASARLSNGIGLANVRARLSLQYGQEHEFSIEEIANKRVQVVITIPLQLSEKSSDLIIGYDA